MLAVERKDAGDVLGYVLAKVGFTETGRQDVDPARGTTLFLTRRL